MKIKLFFSVFLMIAISSCSHSSPEKPIKELTQTPPAAYDPYPEFPNGENSKSIDSHCKLDFTVDKKEFTKETPEGATGFFCETLDLIYEPASTFKTLKHRFIDEYTYQDFLAYSEKITGKKGMDALRRISPNVVFKNLKSAPIEYNFFYPQLKEVNNKNGVSMTVNMKFTATGWKIIGWTVFPGK